MFLNQNKLAIVYLTNNSLVFYSSLNNQSQTLSFTPEIVGDMELKNKPQFISHLENFITQNKISALNLIILMADELCLSQRFLLNNPKITQEIALFLDNVPFEDVASIRTSKPTETIVTTTNKEYFVTVKTVFAKYGCTTLYIIPWIALTTLGLKDNKNFDKSVVDFVMDNYSQLKNYNFPFENELAPTQPQAVENDTQIKKPSHSSLPLLLGLFLFLLLVLGLVIIFSNSG